MTYWIWKVYWRMKTMTKLLVTFSIILGIGLFLLVRARIVRNEDVRDTNEAGETVPIYLVCGIVITIVGIGGIIYNL